MTPSILPILQGLVSMMSGGDFRSGFIAGAAGSLGGHGAEAAGVEGPGLLLASTIAAGTASELSGGKFANGALTGSLVYLFNQAKQNSVNVKVKHSQRIHRVPDLSPYSPGKLDAGTQAITVASFDITNATAYPDGSVGMIEFEAYSDIYILDSIPQGSSLYNAVIADEQQHVMDFQAFFKNNFKQHAYTLANSQRLTKTNISSVWENSMADSLLKKMNKASRASRNFWDRRGYHELDPTGKQNRADPSQNRINKHRIKKFGGLP